MYSYWETGDWDAYIWYWTGEPDPNYQLSAFIRIMWQDLSDGCWKNAEYDALFKKQQTSSTATSGKRSSFDDAQALIYAESSVDRTCLPEQHRGLPQRLGH